MLAIAAMCNWHLQSLDIKAAFLYKLYMQQPEGFAKKGYECKVFHLKRALYGLKLLYNGREHWINL
jgi:hypothetical protein